MLNKPKHRFPYGSVPCGRSCVTVFDAQASASFPPEAPSGDVAVPSSGFVL